MEKLNVKQNKTNDWNARQKKELTMLFLNRSANDTSTFMEKVAEIAQFSGYSTEQIKRLKLAAWYYDIGYTEEFSSNKYEFTNEAMNYLTQMKIDPLKLTRFGNAAKGSQNEVLNDFEKILHDAEFANLVNTKNRKRNLLLRTMISRKFGINYSSKEWVQFIFNMISNRIFYTEYAASKYQDEKINMLNALKVLTQNYRTAN